MFFNKKKKFIENVTALLPVFGITSDEIGKEHINKVCELAIKLNYNQYETVLFTAYAHTNALFNVNPNEAQKFYYKLEDIQSDWINNNFINQNLISDWAEPLNDKFPTTSTKKEDLEYPLEPNMPDMTTSDPEIIFKNDNYVIVFSENIRSIAEKISGEKLPLEFKYVVAVMNQNTNLPNFFVSLETGFTGSYFLSVFNKDGRRLNLGINSELKNKKYFIEKAINIIKEEFDLPKLKYDK